MQLLMVAPSRDAAAGIHKAVLGSLRDSLRHAHAVKLSTLARATGKDPRTVRHHLELLESSGRVLFLDADRTVLATPGTLSKALESAAWDRAGLAALDDLWDNESDERWNDV